MLYCSHVDCEVLGESRVSVGAEVLVVVVDYVNDNPQLPGHVSARSRNQIGYACSDVRLLKRNVSDWHAIARNLLT